MVIERSSTTPPFIWAALALAVAAAVLLPLNLLALQPFHHDEALYAAWSLAIASGVDPWLTDTPIDKPPLFLYVVAGALRLLGATETAARVPSLLASGLSVLLTFWLGRRLYGLTVGLTAAWLLALSPFALMFAPTAFTDPLLVTWMLAACIAASTGQPVWAGIALGLAIATKQQGIFFAPLVGGLLLTAAGRGQESGARAELRGAASSHTEQSGLPRSHLRALTPRQPTGRGPALLRFILAMALVLLPAFLWDAARSQPSGFLVSSLNNYGGLAFDPAGFGERWLGFSELLSYATAAPLLNLLFLAGLPLLLAAGWWLDRRAAAVDWLLALFALGFLLLHTLFSFQVWDRYLLGLLPLLALLLARILWLPPALWRHRHISFEEEKGGRPPLPPAYGVMWAGVIALLLAFSLAGPGRDAVNGRYPLGSNSEALRGIEQVSGYLRSHFGANTTLYHHWLGAHWRFYLWQFPYDLQYWDTPAALAARAQPGHLITFPARRSETEARIALYQAGLSLRELTRAHAPDGSPTVILYQITESRLKIR